MKDGLKPNKIDARDFDFHRTFGNAGVLKYPIFDPEYFCDNGKTMPDQNQAQPQYVPPAPALPYGCTDYVAAELATDLKEGTEIESPVPVENITNANGRRGAQVRDSLAAGSALGWFSAYFNVQAYYPLDYFDAFRLAQVSGAPEKRSISWGTPWFPSWEAACNPSVNPSGIISMPTDQELQNIKANPAAYPWHNSKLDGWTSKNGRLVYRDKSLQGNTIGDKGFIYFPREVINVTMDIAGTVAFTTSMMGIGKPKTISTTIMQWVASMVRNLFGYNRY